MVEKTGPEGKGRSKFAVLLAAMVGVGSLFWAATVENRGFGMFHDELWNLPSAVALVRGSLGVLLTR